MGDTKDEKNKGHHMSEAAEFGKVKHEQDLEDTERDSANPDAKADMRQTLSKPDASGYYERQANNLGGALNLEQDFDPNPGRDLRDSTGTGADAFNVDNYERVYNMYSIPYGMTMKALGRTKDLSTAGAPLTPAEFKKKNPKLAARFAGLTNGEGGSGKASFDSWSRVQKEMKKNVKLTNSSQIKLQSAVYGFRAAQAMIEQRHLAARKAADMAQIAEINETAETLARIVDVSVAALATAAEVEGAISESAAFDENAEGLGDPKMEGVPQSNTPDWVNGTGSDPTAGNLGVGKNTGQKVGGAANDAKGAAKQAGSMAKKIGKAIHEGTGGQLNLTLKDIFIVADGDAAKYDQLNKDIKHIDEQSAKWGDAQFTNTVKKARTELDGAIMEVHAQQMGNKGDSVDARRFASDFANAIGGGTEGELAMYSAEAYQELAAHGDNAHDIRTRMVDGPWHSVYRWLQRYQSIPIGKTAAGNDYRTLKQNVIMVGEEREFLDGALPEWKQRAAEWSHFFSRPLV